MGISADLANVTLLHDDMSSTSKVSLGLALPTLLSVETPISSAGFVVLLRVDSSVESSAALANVTDMAKVLVV